VAFESIRSNLVPGDTNDVSDVFVRDRSSGTTIRVSVASDATQTNAASSWPSISADGRSIAFESFASNLVPNDTNGTSDVFVHERSTT
jgi:Tol biopolymer transport system component